MAARASGRQVRQICGRSRRRREAQKRGRRGRGVGGRRRALGQQRGSERGSGARTGHQRHQDLARRLHPELWRQPQRLAGGERAGERQQRRVAQRRRLVAAQQLGKAADGGGPQLHHAFVCAGRAATRGEPVRGWARTPKHRQAGGQRAGRGGTPVGEGGRTRQPRLGRARFVGAALCNQPGEERLKQLQKLERQLWVLLRSRPARHA